MTKKFIKKLRNANNFEEWVIRLKRFDFELIKENGLQLWTMADFKNYWTQHKGVTA